MGAHPSRALTAAGARSTYSPPRTAERLARACRLRSAGRSARFRADPRPSHRRWRFRGLEPARAISPRRPLSHVTVDPHSTLRFLPGCFYAPMLPPRSDAHADSQAADHPDHRRGGAVLEESQHHRHRQTPVLRAGMLPEPPARVAPARLLDLGQGRADRGVERTSSRGPVSLECEALQYGRVGSCAQRRAALRRDGWRCTCCDAANSPLQVHHLRPVRSGGAELGPANLARVCLRCHGAVHHELDRLSVDDRQSPVAARYGPCERWGYPPGSAVHGAWPRRPCMHITSCWAAASRPRRRLRGPEMVGTVYLSLDVPALSAGLFALRRSLEPQKLPVHQTGSTSISLRSSGFRTSQCGRLAVPPEIDTVLPWNSVHCASSGTRATHRGRSCNLPL